MNLANNSLHEQVQDYMATCPKGLEAALAKEIRELGVDDVQESIAAVYFSAVAALSYRVINWSRIANKIVLVLARERCDDLHAFDQMVQGCRWSDYFDINQTIAVNFKGTNNDIRNVRYGAQRCKDGIQQQFESVKTNNVKTNGRLAVEMEDPDVSIYVRVFKNRYTIGLDLVGDSLHRRGYRAVTGVAPLKENLAAAILQIAGWISKNDDDSNQYNCMVDPLCGSATLLIEAALMRLSIAPSYLRSEDSWLVKRLKCFDADAWQSIRAPIVQQKEQLSLNELERDDSPTLILQGFDIDPRSIEAATANIAAAKMEPYIQIKQSAITDIDLKLTLAGHSFVLPTVKALMVSNPPYGHRLGEQEQLSGLYKSIGELWFEQAQGWDTALFTGNPNLGFSTGFRSWRQHKLYNGSIECQLQRYKIDEHSRMRVKADGAQATIVTKEELSENALMLYNRLAKFQRRFKNQLAQLKASPYRIYDADLSEFNLLIDVYPVAESVYIQVQEYEAPKHVDKNKALQRVRDAVKASAAFFAIERDRVSVKQRSKQIGKQQYQKQTEAYNSVPDRVICTELSSEFWIDAKSYLDTGLFIDSRGVRRWLATNADGNNVLNLFSYTGTATVAMALAGAKSSVSVDMSATYQEWAKQNFLLNKLDLRRHQLNQDDCIKWLENDNRQFDLILLDPPSFSNSKRMRDSLDVQRDHVQLINLAAARLTTAGQLLFCTNKRGFKLAVELEKSYSIQETTHLTLDFDCKQSRHVHRSWVMALKSELSDKNNLPSKQKKSEFNNVWGSSRSK